MNSSESENRPNNNIEAIYPLTPAQEGMLFHTRASGDPTMYFEQHRCTLHGWLDRSAFEEAWQMLVQRHAALRSLFVWKRREPLQLVQKQVAVSWTYEDWRDDVAQGADALEARLEQFLADDRHRGFDLAKAPLMRLALIRVDDQEHRFVWSFHHAAVDGWSASTIFKELFALYDKLSQGVGGELSTPRPYQQYVRWLKDQDMATAESFWRQTLAGFSTATPIRFGIATARDTGETYAQQSITLSTATTARLHGLTREYRVTTNAILLGAWACLLSRYSGEDDVLFGAIVSGRPAELPGVEEMVGMFINTLPVRALIKPAQSVGQWLQVLQAQQAAARQYEFTPLVQIQNWSDVPNAEALFDSIVLFENHPVDSTLWEGNDSLRVSDVQVFEQTNYGLTLASWPAPEFPLQLRYDPSRFDKNSIARVLEHLQVLLENFASDAAQPIAKVPMLTEHERQIILHDWNATTRTLPDAQSVPALFEAQTERTPNSVALIDGGQTVTYTKLNHLANRIAHDLVAYNIAAGDHVAICIERSPLAIASILAVLKTGAAYLPLDPAYPAERLNLLLTDSQAQLLLLRQDLAVDFPGYAGTVLSMEGYASNLDAGHEANIENLSRAISGDDAAYLIYTSGSTGRPKGVRGLHRGIVNRCEWMRHAFPFSETDICCQKTALSFVDSVYEIFGPLLHGVPLVLISDQVARDPMRLVRELAEQQVTRLIAVPSLLRTILGTHTDLGQTLPTLTLCTSSGETLPFDLAQHFCQQMPHTKLINLYGSSEVSADATIYEIVGDEEGSIPIGRPIANTQLYLLDRHQNLTPIGVPGEVYVGGAGLAAGYWAQPEFTVERFQALNGRPLFRTGDLARYREDGQLEYLGRIDNQVKIRGMRVELSEIENALDALSSVRESTVLLRDDDQAMAHRLVAYVVLTGGQEFEPGQLQDRLASRLPEYMIPRLYVRIDALPLLPNGKVDRQALTQFELDDSRNLEEYVAPDGPIEEMLAEVWREVLNIEQIGVHDNFFRLGGHSLLATQVASQLLQEYEIDLPLQLLFDAPTIAALSPLVEEILMKEMV